MTLMFEGAWEEIAQHAPELAGRRLRIIALDDTGLEAGLDHPSEIISSEQLEALLLQGLQSGPPIEATAEYWQQKQTLLLKQMAKKNQPV